LDIGLLGQRVPRVVDTYSDDTSACTRRSLPARAYQLGVDEASDSRLFDFFTSSTRRVISDAHMSLPSTIGQVQVHQVQVHHCVPVGLDIESSVNGSATLETDAVIDLDLGLNQPGQSLRTVSVRLQGEIDPAVDHASVQLWLANRHYLVVGDRPDASPDQALRKVVDAVNHQDWGAVYDMGAPTLQQMANRSDFISGMTTGWQSHLGTGRVDVRLTSEQKLIDSTFGYWTAQTGLRVSAGANSFTFTVILEYVGKRWLLLAISAAP
jgi:hypothetical protein